MPYTLNYGIHRGTLISRDCVCEEYNTEKEAHQAFVAKQEYHTKTGYNVWYAYIVTPNGDKIQLAEPNISYH